MAKGILRIGKAVPFKSAHITQYFHVKCAFESFSKARSAANNIRDINVIDGIDLVSPEEKLQITKLIDATKYIAPQPRLTTRRCVPSTVHVHKSRKEPPEPSNLPAIKILFTNADQLTTSKMIELKAQILENKPLLVAVSEVKHTNSNEWCNIDYDIPGYTLHPVNLDNDNGRGIAVYSHESIDKSDKSIDKSPTRWRHAPFCLLLPKSNPIRNIRRKQ